MKRMNEEFEMQANACNYPRSERGFSRKNEVSFVKEKNK